MRDESNEDLDELARSLDKQRKAEQERQANRPTIRLVAGEIERIVAEAETAVIQSGRKLYQRDGKIAYVSYSTAKTNEGEDTTTIQILERGDTALLVDISAAANFEKFDKRSKDWVAADPPMAIVGALKEEALALKDRAEYRLGLPVLHGVVTAPTMRADGSILDEPGYDEATGLLFDPLCVEFPPISQRPSRAAAEGSLKLLSDLIKDFPFKTKTDRSVALSAILTACVRRCLANAPLHAYSAPVAGTGKSKLADIACVISTGFEASPLLQGADDEETEKRISAKLMTGEAFIAIDNCTRPLGGDLICSMLTQKRVSPRILGKSKTPSLTAGAFVTAGGQGLVIKGDLTRRTVLCRIDAQMEQPEKRTFALDPVRQAMERRPEYVVAVLTILRAYHVAGKPERPNPLGSFEAWSDLVRGALIWLGKDDPVAPVDELRKSDPTLESTRAIMGQWVEAIGTTLQVTTADIIKAATEEHRVHCTLLHPDFVEALMVVAGRGGVINGRALGIWLQAHQERIVDDLKFVRIPQNRQGAAVWRLAQATPKDGLSEGELGE